jgi:hypothetical protein
VFETVTNRKLLHISRLYRHDPAWGRKLLVMAMNPSLTAMGRNLRSIGLVLSVCLLGWETQAPAAEPIVLHGSDTFTFEIVPNRPGCPAATNANPSLACVDNRSNLS